VNFKSDIPDPAEAAKAACTAGVDLAAKKCGKSCDCLEKAVGGNGFSKDGHALCQKAADDIRNMEPDVLQWYGKAQKTGKLVHRPLMKRAFGKNFCAKVENKHIEDKEKIIELKKEVKETKEEANDEKKDLKRRNHELKDQVKNEKKKVQKEQNKIKTEEKKVQKAQVGKEEEKPKMKVEQAKAKPENRRSSHRRRK